MLGLFLQSKPRWGGEGPEIETTAREGGTAIETMAGKGETAVETMAREGGTAVETTARGSNSGPEAMAREEERELLGTTPTYGLSPPSLRLRPYQK